MANSRLSTDFAQKKILLGVTGGIAAYKSAYFVRALQQLGAEVRVVMTESAKQFIAPLTFQALSGHPVRSALFDAAAEDAMNHIELARWADYLVIAPASAHCLAQLAHGLADDLLSTLYLVCNRIPVIVCPAMNRNMWAHSATQTNSRILREHGVILVGPTQGEQACGDIGLGRMLEPEWIIDALRLADQRALYGALKGQRIVITAGPTWEMIDPVRVISNRSSGKMGYALAWAACYAGAEVILISGPTAINPPPGVELIIAQSADLMHQAVMQHLLKDDIFIGCAAVCDFKVTQVSSQKIKKSQQPAMILELTPNPDILEAVASSQKCQYVVGFSAETCQVELHAREKLQKKRLDMIIANEVGETKGFDQTDNAAMIIAADQIKTLPSMHKTRLAGLIIQEIATNSAQKTSKKKHKECI